MIIQIQHSSAILLAAGLFCTAFARPSHYAYARPACKTPGKGEPHPCRAHQTFQFTA
jgi:hypothetical protein